MPKAPRQGMPSVHARLLFIFTRWVMGYTVVNGSWSLLRSFCVLHSVFCVLRSSGSLLGGEWFLVLSSWFMVRSFCVLRSVFSVLCSAFVRFPASLWFYSGFRVTSTGHLAVLDFAPASRIIQRGQGKSDSSCPGTVEPGKDNPRFPQSRCVAALAGPQS